MRIKPQIILSFFLIDCLAMQNTGSFPVHKMEVSGNSRLRSEAILKVSGLQLGQAASRADFDSACQRLLASGFIQQASYRYATVTVKDKPGYNLTLMVSETPAELPVLLDIPGVEEARLWDWLDRYDGLLQKIAPSPDQALQRYSTAIEQFLIAEKHPVKITPKTEEDRATRKLIVIFQPQQLSAIASVDFDGNRTIASESLKRVLNPLTRSRGFTELTVRRLLDLNLRPLYEELGRLKVSFPSVSGRSGSADSVSVLVAIEEGPVFQLGNIKLSGYQGPEAELLSEARFQTGKVANWKEFEAGVDRMKQQLSRTGYLAAAFRTDRRFRDNETTVDAVVSVERGRQFLFGELRLSGLDPTLEALGRRMWKLPSGAPMNQPYINEFAKELFRSELAKNLKGISQNLQVRPQTAIVDVSISFR